MARSSMLKVRRVGEASWPLQTILRRTSKSQQQNVALQDWQRQRWIRRLQQ
jgi:hypothetical protein